MKRAILAGVLVLIAAVIVPASVIQTPASVTIGGGPGAVVLQPPSLSPSLAKTVDPIIDALWSRFSGRSALSHVQFISRYWRLPGNVGYNATINRVHRRLVEAGFLDRTAKSTPGVDLASRPTSSLWVEEYPNSGKGWSYSVGTVAIAHDGRPDEIVLSRDKQNLSLCINSFSTPAGGVLAPLVDVGRGREADFTGKDVKGAVVLGDGDAGGLVQTALSHGAIGAISTSLGDYVSPDRPGAPPTAREDWNILQWGSIRYDEARKSFGFKATPHAATTLRSSLAAAKGASPVMVRVTIASTFSDRPNRMVVAEIPGKLAANERVVITAHVQEPGANDNASGVATLTELARAMRLAIRSGAIPPPERTITFLWLEEISGSRQWLTSHAEQAKNVKYMFSMDMTGEDVRKTGGSFLIERWPDPGAVWDRPWDPHSEWGRGNVRENQLKGDLLNDFHLAICARVAAKTGWVVKTNPYEGGSDHSEFGRAGIPSVLDWHFTDRYYHSNYDTADKSSPNEMRNVGVAVAASAWLLASANEKTTLDVAGLVADAGQRRIGIEEHEGQALAASAADAPAAKAREATIVQAWRKWYDEAIRSAARLLVGAPSATFAKALDDLAVRVEKRPEMDGDEPEPAMQSPMAPRDALLLAADRIQAARWYPAGPAKRGPTPDELLLRDSLASRVPNIRAAAVRAVGRFENAADAPTLIPFLKDSDPAVRREAAQAIAQALKQSRGEAVLPAQVALQASLDTADAATRSAVLEALARLRYDHAVALQVAPLLARAPDMLAILARQDRQIRLTDDALQVLRRVANIEGPVTAGDVDPAEAGRPREAIAHDALEALYLVGGVDVPLATWALSYHCSTSPKCGWDTRFLATQQLDVKQPALAAELERLRRDPAYQVRLAALSKLATFIPTLQACRPFLDAATAAAEMTMVRLEAIRLMDPRCVEREEISGVLTSLAEQLGNAGKDNWHVPARAMETLVKFRPTAAEDIAGRFAIGHAAWQVRASAARTATALKDEAVLVKLATDSEPNVRTEAVNGLAQIKSLAVNTAAVSALSSDDHQLVRAASLALKGATEPETAVPALFAAFKRLTKKGADNSRDARMAILDRLKELARSDRPGVSVQPYISSDDLRPFLRDFDPNVAAAVADLIGLMTNARPDPSPERRPPQQVVPSPRPPRAATIILDNGDTIPLTLLPDEAPLAVARFAQLAAGHYYDGLTFHRVVPLFVIQGGSPGANEYVGDSRFMRDEIGFERHTRGAVGLSTRGRDTGDGQIFIDLTDQPRLNYDYTIFARVQTTMRAVAPAGTAGRSGMDAVDAVLEGTRIRTITIGR